MAELRYSGVVLSRFGRTIFLAMAHGCCRRSDSQHDGLRLDLLWFILQLQTPGDIGAPTRGRPYHSCRCLPRLRIKAGEAET
jgi:hypothetical protein